MALLKEYGSLDIERINQLPIEEYMDVIGDLTEEQLRVYISKLQKNESKTPMKAIVVESIERYGVDADAFLNNMRDKYGIKNELINI